jgi:hypothetical protein
VKYYSKKHFTGTISTTRSSTKRAVDGLADMIASVRQDAIEGTPSPDVASHQGIAVGPDYYYVIHTTSIDRYTHSWVATGTNEDPMEGLDLEQAHLGDGCYYQGKLYIPAENWPTVSDQHILVYDAGTLERLKSIPTNKTHEVSSITVAQIDGADRLVISSYLDSSRLFLYELDGTFYRELPLTPMVPYGIQGVAYRDGRLYIASGRLYGVGNLWTATLEGSATPLYTRIQPGTHEGLEFDGDTLLWLVDQKTAGSRFTTLRFPSFMLPTP